MAEEGEGWKELQGLGEFDTARIVGKLDYLMPPLPGYQLCTISSEKIQLLWLGKGLKEKA